MDQPEMQVRVERRTSMQSPEIRLIRMKEVIAICAMSKSSIYEAIKKEGFPKPVRLHGRTSAWIKSEVLLWAQLRIQASRAAPPL
ncbi:MAG: AlpA family phage regulatory protein [Bdellovibrionales bacterium]|nr:AlpA family phage regulatory protein [Massilia sp.]